MHSIRLLLMAKRGIHNTPKQKRWVGKLKALYARHEALVQEMEKRGYSHKSPLNAAPSIDSDVQDALINSIAEQKELLNNKKLRLSLCDLIQYNIVFSHGNIYDSNTKHSYYCARGPRENHPG
ncbi:MAG: hypothetical protein UZ22_OP11002000732 [Microgenomates bacterium OLB23]|nr:MAG: hypothetical protein UZ22_OP11002000732 [Microgenomates bacterium OLB23]